MKVSVNSMRVVLASSSPRRRELMKEFNIPFEIITKETDERFSGEDIIKDCMNVAKRKAMAVYKDISSDVIVIGSDTIVVKDNKVYGKPKDYSDAVSMLTTFSGTSHEVISSLCLLIRKDNIEYEELTYDKCKVYFDELTREEIDEWINSNDVYSKAGAYAIQEGFGKHIIKIEGDYFSIVGLPIHKLYELLKKYI